MKCRIPSDYKRFSLKNTKTEFFLAKICGLLLRANFPHELYTTNRHRCVIFKGLCKRRGD